MYFFILVKICTDSKYYLREVMVHVTDVKELYIISRSYNTTPVTGFMTQRYTLTYFFIDSGFFFDKGKDTF